MRQIGINTFGLGELLINDFDGTFQTLKEAGYTAVEPVVVSAAALGIDPDQMVQGLSRELRGKFWVDKEASASIARLRTMGLAVEGAHLGLVGIVPGGLSAVLPHMGRFARENGLSYLVHSPQKKTIAEVQADVSAFRRGLGELREQGIKLLFHCHYDEFECDGAECVFDYLLREIPELQVQLDVGWVHYAGQDVVELMRRYADRIVSVHFKDIGAVGKKEFCAIGGGDLPLREIVREAEKLTLMDPAYIVDQDSSNGDMLADLRTGLQNIRACESA